MSKLSSCLKLMINQSKKITKIKLDIKSLFNSLIIETLTWQNQGIYNKILIIIYKV